MCFPYLYQLKQYLIDQVKSLCLHGVQSEQSAEQMFTSRIQELLGIPVSWVGVPWPMHCMAFVWLSMSLLLSIVKDIPKRNQKQMLPGSFHSMPSLVPDFILPIRVGTWTS